MHKETAVSNHAGAFLTGIMLLLLGALWAYSIVMTRAGGKGGEATTKKKL